MIMVHSCPFALYSTYNTEIKTTLLRNLVNKVSAVICVSNGIPSL